MNFQTPEDSSKSRKTPNIPLLILHLYREGVEQLVAIWTKTDHGNGYKKNTFIAIARSEFKSQYVFFLLKLMNKKVFSEN